MAILADKNTKILVQGITGKTGRFHTEISLKYGSKIVAGVTPGKGGETVLGVPVFNTVAEAVKKFSVDASLIFVPPAFALGAIQEAIAAKIPLIVVITEGIPVLDMVKVKEALKNSKSRLIGPNSPGLLVPNETRMGIIPGAFARPGAIGVVSRSGTLTYEAMDQITQAGLGVSTVVGIGGDPVIGSDFIDIIKAYDQDPKTQAILMIGEIGGRPEEQAALFWKNDLKARKSLFTFIAGKTAPPGKRMGHAGAIMEGAADSAQEKAKALAALGAIVIEDLNSIGKTLKSHLN